MKLRSKETQKVILSIAKEVNPNRKPWTFLLVREVALSLQDIGRMAGKEWQIASCHTEAWNTLHGRYS